MMHVDKYKKFNGLNFKRWQQKILFYLTTLNLIKFLTEKTPKLSKDEYDPTKVPAMDDGKHNDFVCKKPLL